MFISAHLQALYRKTIDDVTTFNLVLSIQISLIIDPMVD